MSHLISSSILGTGWSPPLPLGASPSTPIIIVIGPGAGGIIKTGTALAIGSVAKAAGHVVLYIDADAGIGSLSSSLKFGGDYRVDTFPTVESADYARTLLQRAKDLSATVIIIDLGANEMMRATSNRTLKATFSELRNAGCKTYSVMSLTPFKVGLEEDAATFGDRTGKYAEVVLFFHGRNEGGDFKELDKLKDNFPKFVEVTKHQPAIVGIMGSRQVLPFDFAREPGPEFSIAGAWVARNLQLLAEQPVMQEMLACDCGVRVLQNLAKAGPSRHFLNRVAQWQVSDDVLRADDRFLLADMALSQSIDLTDEPRILLNAKAYILAQQDRKHQKSIAFGRQKRGLLGEDYDPIGPAVAHSS